MRWTLTDTSLFDGLAYGDEPTDHFYTDHFRRMCVSVVGDDDAPGLIDVAALEDLLAGEHHLETVLQFFNGLDPEDGSRLRWDRLVAFQLVLMAFIETFGYEIHKTDRSWFDSVAGRMRPEVATNLLDWLPKLGIGDNGWRAGRRDPGGQLAVAALKEKALRRHSNRLRTQASLPAGADPLL
jgi:hypothetical protein